LLIVKLNHSQTQFRYGPLNGVDEDIILIEGFRGENFQDLPTLLNLLDSIQVVVKEKYQKPRIINSIGHAVITSNQAIRNTGYPSHDQDVLKTKFTETEFKEPPLNLVGRAMELFDRIDSNQWVSFGFYANSLYLNKRGMNAYVPASSSLDNLITKATVIGEPSQNQIKWFFAGNSIHLDQSLFKVNPNKPKNDS
ncbi:MAG: hypothetical protein WA913_16935, partial [Pricia sp.]